MTVFEKEDVMNYSYAQQIRRAELQAAAGALIRARGKPKARLSMIVRIRAIRQRVGVTKEEFFDCFKEVVRKYEADWAQQLRRL